MVAAGLSLRSMILSLTASLLSGNQYLALSIQLSAISSWPESLTLPFRKRTVLTWKCQRLLPNLSRRTNLSEEGRIRLEEAFQVNRRMFKAYFLKEDLSRLWEFASPEAARRFFHNWVQNIRWQRIPAFWKLAQTLRVHLEGIVNFCQENVRFGVVEAINTTVKSVMRRGRGYRDHEYLKLKLMWITANPVIHT